jgi:hypothetical protein
MRDSTAAAPVSQDFDLVRLQVPLTNDLADELQAAGHEVTTRDLLDCLASAGLAVIRSPGTAADAYFTMP